MKLLFVCEGLTDGGAEHFTATMANYFCKADGYEVAFMTPPRQENEYPLNRLIRRYPVMRRGRYLLADAAALKRIAHREKVSVVIGIGFYANLMVCLANIRMEAKAIISERNAPRQDQLSPLSRMLRFLCYRNADAYVFQTKQAKECYSKRIQSRAVVIHNPVAPDLPYRSGVCRHEIVAVGRLNKQKNYPLLLKAFREVSKRHPDYRLRIFGQGKLKGLLEREIEALHLSGKVCLEGFCLNVHEQIADSDLFVMSSDFEGMPNALLEAMAMGFPVISTDCPSGGPGEVICDGQNGILIGVGREKELEEAICFLIENPYKKTALGRNACAIRHTHSIEQIAAQWETLF